MSTNEVLMLIKPPNEKPETKTWSGEVWVQMALN